MQAINHLPATMLLSQNGLASWTLKMMNKKDLKQNHCVYNTTLCLVALVSHVRSLVKRVRTYTGIVMYAYFCIPLEKAPISLQLS